MNNSRIKPSEEAKYIDAMELARASMKLVLINLQKELIPIIPESKHASLINLHLAKHEADPNLLCFDDMWSTIKKIFDTIRDDSSPEKIALGVNELKALIFKLEHAGIPLQLNKDLNFWSTQLGRTQAEIYSAQTNTTTDTMATAYYRKLFLEWPEENLQVFYPIIKVFPELSLLFWTTISDIYLDRVRPGSEAHVFFQDSLLEGNYFWNTELPRARAKNIDLIIHVFDPQTNKWKDPVRLDSKEGNEIYIRRRKINPLDGKVANENIFISTLNEKLWKKSYKDGPDSASPVTFWSAPKILTVGKLRNITEKIINHYRNNKKK